MGPGNLCVDIFVKTEKVRWRKNVHLRKRRGEAARSELNLALAPGQPTRGWLYVQMPPAAEVKSESLLGSLMQHPPARESWEVGGNCNFMVAAARLGLQVAALGNLGDDTYGSFLRAVLKVRLLYYDACSPLRNALCAASRAFSVYVYQAHALPPPALQPCGPS